MEKDNIKKKVLVVDDEPNVRRLLHTILSKNFEVFEGEDGKQAMEIANTQKPDVILMDMMMPKMDGLTACHMIKNNSATRSIPVIMVTAIGFELNVKLSQQMGASGYVTKPFSSQVLLDKIAEVLAAPGIEPPA